MSTVKPGGEQDDPRVGYAFELERASIRLKAAMDNTQSGGDPYTQFHRFI